MAERSPERHNTMIRVIQTGAAVAALLWPVVAFGLTSEELYGACLGLGSPGKEAQSIFCTAYVSGVIDGINVEHQGSSRLCIPKGTTVQKVAEVVQKWLATQPPESRQKYPAEGDVMWAVERAWPCTPAPAPPGNLKD
jgi:Rap1a immunity proteins